MKELLSAYKKEDVDIYISYINRLKTEKKNNELKNKWAGYIKPNQYADAFKLSVKNGLPIDGQSITINYRGKLLITYDYHAYKNKVISIYPDSIFDFGIVYTGDNYTFRKENGKVIYTHDINNPFDTEKIIIGAYGIIKNETGEFIELLDDSDLSKMRQSSLIQNIWDKWPDRMALKSVIKRICSTHFYDIVKDIDKIDNQSTDPDRVMLNPELIKAIDEVDNIEQLNLLFRNNTGTTDNEEIFVEMCAKRKEELRK